MRWGQAGVPCRNRNARCSKSDSLSAARHGGGAPAGPSPTGLSSLTPPLANAGPVSGHAGAPSSTPRLQRATLAPASDILTGQAFCLCGEDPRLETPPRPSLTCSNSVSSREDGPAPGSQGGTPAALPRGGSAQPDLHDELAVWSPRGRRCGRRRTVAGWRPGSQCTSESPHAHPLKVKGISPEPFLFTATSRGRHRFPVFAPPHPQLFTRHRISAAGDDSGSLCLGHRFLCILKLPQAIRTCTPRWKPRARNGDPHCPLTTNTAPSAEK